MALASVGLKTYIWNNQITSVLLLLGYPLLLLILIWMFFAGLTAYGNYEHQQQSANDAYTQSYDELSHDPVEAGWQGVERYGHIAFIVAGVWFVISFFFHQNMINAATGARPMERAENPRVYNLLENLCISRGITMPKLYVIDSDVLNAYASGISQKSYAVTLTRGIVDALTDEELEAVIAHELTHIQNSDVRLLIISIVFVGMISFLAEMLFRGMMRGMRFRSGDRKGGGAAVVVIAFLVLIIGYFFALIIRFALSQRREYMADAGGVELTKNPAALARALRKISGNSKLDAPGEVQQMFIDSHSNFFGIFATHPPIEKRIAILEDLAGESTAPQTASPNPSQGPWG